MRFVSVALMLALPAPAFAQTAANSGDSGWLIAASALAMLAVLPGLALHFAGRFDAKDAAASVTATVAAAAAATLAWGLIGYSLAFGEGGALIGGIGNALLGNLVPLLEPFTVPEASFALYQAIPAAFAAVLIAGASAGRARLGWMCGFAFLWTLFAYAPIARALLGDGLLAAFGALDYAGGAVVHVSAGTAALVVALMLGRRRESADVPGPTPISLGGAALVWVGWFGIAGGAGIGGGEDAAYAIFNAHLAASAGALVGLFIGRSIGAGAIAGLAASAASLGFIGAPGAILLGAIGALAAMGAVRLLRASFVDDPHGVVAVHGVAGALGMLLAPVFMLQALGGLGLPDGGSVIGLLAAQASAVGAVALWAALATLIAGYMAAAILPMRAPPDAA